VATGDLIELSEEVMRHLTAVLGLAVALCAPGCKQKSDPPRPSDPGAAAPDRGSATQGSARAAPAPGAPLTIGVTLHPYFSWTANVVKDVPGVTVVPLLPGEVDAGNYQPATGDVAKIAGLDAIVENGIGHDDFIKEMVKASGNTKLIEIAVNADTPTVPSANSTAPNSHTFISFTNAIQQSAFIAKKLGELRPDLAAQLMANAEAYGDRLAQIRTAAATKLANAAIQRVVTVHDGYSYLLQEFGIEVAGVVEPSHGLTPSAKELTDMIALMKQEQIKVVFSEETFPAKLMTTLQEGTGANVYIISHVAIGNYAADEFERVMQANADVLVKALVDDPAK